MGPAVGDFPTHGRVKELTELTEGLCWSIFSARLMDLKSVLTLTGQRGKQELEAIV